MLDRTVAWLARRSALELVLLLALVAEALFLWDLGHPARLMFDETYYVPAGRSTYGMTGPANVEHPLFAKWLIGLSMALFGDTPFGWRVLSTLAGTATMVSLFAIALALFRDRRAAVTAALIALLDQMLFIQARIAMLDVFMGAFLTAGIALALWGWRTKGDARPRLFGAGLCLGLAVGCKWTAIPYVALACAAAAIAQFRDPAAFRRAGRWTPALWIGVPALAAYFATFAPALGYAEQPLRPGDLIGYQLFIYGEQIKPLSAHTYMSDWWQWPLISRPIWYFYEVDDGAQRGVILLGNPAVMWGGLIAVGACLWWGLKARSTPLLWAAGGYLFAIGVWIVIPKKIGFYYYYYLPALLLSIALAGALHHMRSGRVAALFLAVAAAMFVYFLPIISAAPLADAQAFRHWMWFSSWP
ncbi:glycosyltransferase family 39 protein [Sphingomonas flavalba]|uniref:glycosyltransferase family 39 protein n=1 Tax=Sphingomonas flavalba TaxID=2559804 RepID=UPI0039E0F751